MRGSDCSNDDDDDLCGDGGDAYLRLYFDGGVLWLLVEREGVEEGVVQVRGQHKTTVDIRITMRKILRTVKADHGYGYDNFDIKIS